MRNNGFGGWRATLLKPSYPEVDISLPGFEELALPLLDSLYNFARWMARDSYDAEDLVQETYLKALRGFSSFQPGTNFRAWMFRILKNSFLSSCSKLDHRMTVALNLEEEGAEIPIDHATPETVLIERTNSQMMQSAIDELPVHFRETLLLCEVEEMTYREIAEILSIPIGTVMSRLARARKAVRDQFPPHSAEQPNRCNEHRRETIVF